MTFNQLKDLLNIIRYLQLDSSNQNEVAVCKLRKAQDIERK